MPYMNYKLILLSALLFTAPGAISAHHTLTLARAPQLSASVMSQLWSPFINYLTETTGHKIKLKIYSEREAFEADIKDAKVELYFGNPGYGIVGHLNHGYIPLIRSDRKLLEGIIVTRKDSGIENIQQLSGKQIAFPSPRAFAASLFIHSHLSADFNIDYQPVYTGSHDNTYRAVQMGKFIAGGGVVRTLERESPLLQEQLRIIYTTPGIKPHPLMAHPNVSLAIRQSIQESILRLDLNENGKTLLKNINLQKPVVADYSRDYQPIEKLATKMYPNLLH